MLYTVAVTLMVLWLLGLVASPAAGGLAHILLVIAVTLILGNLISGRNRPIRAAVKQNKMPGDSI